MIGNDFGFTMQTPTVTVTAGSYVQAWMLVSLQSATAPVTFSAAPCSGLPTETVCGVPGTVSYTSPAQIDIQTQGPHTQVRRTSSAISTTQWRISFSLAVCGIFLLHRPRRKRAAPWIATVFVLMLVSLSPACGGGNNASGGGSPPPPPPPAVDPGTPKGTYTITVTGTSGNISHTATFQLIVQ